MSTCVQRCTSHFSNVVRGFEHEQQTTGHCQQRRFYHITNTTVHSANNNTVAQSGQRMSAEQFVRPVRILLNDWTHDRFHNRSNEQIYLVVHRVQHVRCTVQPDLTLTLCLDIGRIARNDDRKSGVCIDRTQHLGFSRQERLQGNATVLSLPTRQTVSRPIKYSISDLLEEPLVLQSYYILRS